MSRVQTSASDPEMLSSAGEAERRRGMSKENSYPQLQHHATSSSSGSRPKPPRPRRTQSHEPAPLKERLYTALSRFRYGWNFRSSVEIYSGIPIWLLGHCYHAEHKDQEGAPPHIMAFMEHFNSLTWMTYRTNFPPIEGTNITTDCGWGCMVRSGQMILATALNRFLLGPQWRINGCTPEERRMHRQILSWFADSPDPKCPFSMHALMRAAITHGHRPGNWFGPSQLALLIRECVADSRSKFPVFEELLVYVAHDCTVYVGDVKKLYENNLSRSLLVLVPIRLGSEALNPIYIPCVKSLLALDHCVGIIGGKPKHSVYFVGFQEDKLVHLDPHYCQMAAEPTEDQNFRDVDVKTYHCHTPRKLAASRMDPSCTIGFLCSSFEDFKKMRADAEKVLAPPLQKGVYPFFSFSDISLEEMLDASVNMRLGSLTDNNLFIADTPSPRTRSGRRKGRKGSDTLDGLVFCDDEDFVVVECMRNPSLEEESSVGSPVREDDTFSWEGEGVDESWVTAGCGTIGLKPEGEGAGLRPDEVEWEGLQVGGAGSRGAGEEVVGDHDERPSLDNTLTSIGEEACGGEDVIS